MYCGNLISNCYLLRSQYLLEFDLIASIWSLTTLTLSPLLQIQINLTSDSLCSNRPFFLYRFEVLDEEPGDDEEGGGGQR